MAVASGALRSSNRLDLWQLDNAGSEAANEGVSGRTKSGQLPVETDASAGVLAKALASAGAPWPARRFSAEVCLDPGRDNWPASGMRRLNRPQV